MEDGLFDDMHAHEQYATVFLRDCICCVLDVCCMVHAAVKVHWLWGQCLVPRAAAAEHQAPSYKS